MAEPTYLLLAVNSERAADLRSALEKREYIKIVELDRETRKKLAECPACRRKFSRETTYTITEELVESLAIMLAGMRQSKSVVIINKKNHLKDVIMADRGLWKSLYRFFEGQYYLSLWNTLWTENRIPTLSLLKG